MKFQKLHIILDYITNDQSVYIFLNMHQNKLLGLRKHYDCAHLGCLEPDMTMF